MPRYEDLTDEQLYAGAYPEALAHIECLCLDMQDLAKHARDYLRSTFRENSIDLHTVPEWAWTPVGDFIRVYEELTKRFILKLNEDPTNVTKSSVRTAIGQMRAAFVDVTMVVRDITTFPDDLRQILFQLPVFCDTYLDQAPNHPRLN